MKNANEPVIGTRLELELVGNDGAKTGGPFISQLLEPVSDEEMIVSSPIFEARLIFIPVNTRIRLTYIHKKYGLLGFTAVVSERESRGNIAVLHIQRKSEIEKIQRRNHYRFQCSFSAEFRILDRNGSQDSEEIPAVKAVTKNISGSGVCIVTSKDIPKNTAVELTIHFNDTLKVKVVCIVMRNTPFEIKKSASYELGLHFTEISPRDQNFLIKYIFEQQRLLLKKDILDK